MVPRLTSVRRPARHAVRNHPVPLQTLQMPRLLRLLLRIAKKRTDDGVLRRVAPAYGIRLGLDPDRLRPRTERRR